MKVGIPALGSSLESEQQTSISRTLLLFPGTLEECNTFVLCNKPGLDPCTDIRSLRLGQPFLKFLLPVKASTGPSSRYPHGLKHFCDLPVTAALETSGKANGLKHDLCNEFYSYISNKILHHTLSISKHPVWIPWKTNYFPLLLLIEKKDTEVYWQEKIWNTQVCLLKLELSFFLVDYRSQYFQLP